MGTNWQPDLLQNGIPKYRALLNAIRDAAEQGALPAGDKLPPVREMAWQLKITPGTVARAYQIGIDEGFLEAQVGRGTFVKKKEITLRLKHQSFGETHVETGVVDLRNAAIPYVGQDEVIAELSQRLEFSGSHSMVRYAEDWEAPIRSTVLEWMGLDGIRANSDDLVLTYGSQNATLAAFLATLHGSSPVIATESLILPGTRQAAALARAKIVGLATDHLGLIPHALEEMCRRDRPQVLHLSANISSPTATLMSPLRMSEIADIARHYDLQIIEDDGHGKFFPERPQSFLHFCSERVWHVSSLSRYLAAGLRAGFLLCPPGKREVGVGVMQGLGHSFSPMIGQLVLELVQSGRADQLLDKIRTHRQERVRVAVNELGGLWKINWHEAASFIWLELPEGWSASSFSLAAEKAGIQVAPADMFLPSDGVAPNAVRISLGGKHKREIYTDALVRLDELLANPPREMLA